jgi:maltose 6'-phosphate phosphatase
MLSALAKCRMAIGKRDWTARLGRVLGMKHAYVGKISSANHKDKYKSLLSRTPLTGMNEIEITKGFRASLFGAETVVRGVPILVYSTHIAGTAKADGSAADFIAKSVIPKSKASSLVLLGDLNNLLGDQTLNRIEPAGMRSTWSDLGIATTRLSSHLHIETGKESGVIDHLYSKTASGAKAIDGGVIYNAFNPLNEDKKMPRYRGEWEQFGKPLSDHRPIWAVLEFPQQ